MVVKAAQDNFLYLSDGETFRHHTKPEIMKEKTVLFSYGIRTHTPNQTTYIVYVVDGQLFIRYFRLV